MWGGDALYTARHGNGALVTRMLAKHGSSRMAYRHCKRWLEHMLAATDEVSRAGNGAVGDVSGSLARYWLHFFGFFPLTAEQRRELRALALGDGKAKGFYYERKK